MESSGPIVTLTTDFGSADGYVGAIKGVVLGICPQAQLVDITHEIAAQDILQAAFALYNAARFFPAGAVHLAVVDPGVGTDRRPLAVRAGNMHFVGPDNGLLTLVAQPADPAVVLDNPAFCRRAAEIGYTFHGRDIFAPAAAHLAAGVPLAELGSPAGERVTLSIPTPIQRDPYTWSGEVLYRDHFGNAITNLGVLISKADGLELSPLAARAVPTRLPAGRARVTVRGRELLLARTYGDVARGEPLALIGSGGLLEIAVRDGNAAAELGLEPGEPVYMTITPIAG